MKKDSLSFSYTIYNSADELPAEEAVLLKESKKAIKNSHAPYSNFHVGAAARMANGKIVTGSNQENASFPAGLCAERVLLAAAASLYPAEPISMIAISYNNANGKSDHPVSPCGICRQSLFELEERFKSPIKLILAGMKGEVYLIERIRDLLPLAFTF